MVSNLKNEESKMINNSDLIQRAIGVLNPRRLSSYQAEAGGVGAALLDEEGGVHVGVCIDVACSVGFCAEHSAIASLVTAGKSKIKKIVAVDWDQSILPPCGRCREFIYQIHDDNQNTQVIIADDEVLPLKELLPHHWFNNKKQREGAY